jgi:hypothetical protein
VYNSQVHVPYITIDQQVWDIWCSPFPQGIPPQWNKQRIDVDAGTLSVQAGPSAGVYNNQQHFCYVRGIAGGSGDDPSAVYDTFYDGADGSLHPQGIGLPNPVFENLNFIPPVMRFPFLVSIWEIVEWDQQHFTCLGNDPFRPKAANATRGTDIIDTFYDPSGWSPHYQRINNKGNTDAPPAYSKPFGCVFRPTSLISSPTNPGQQHIAYLAGDGSVWDAWFDGVIGNPWKPQQLNNKQPNNNALTDAPVAIGGPCAWTVPSEPFSPYDHQLHFAYLGNRGEIWDVWYNDPFSKWESQRLNINAYGPPFHTTNAPPAAVDPAAVVAPNMVSGHTVVEQHVAYRDASGIIWDLWYDGAPTWHWRPINDGTPDSPAAIGNISLGYLGWSDNDGTLYGQLHCAWRAQPQAGEKGQEIWDAWYNLNPLPGQPGGRG